MKKLIIYPFIILAFGLLSQTAHAEVDILNNIEDLGSEGSPIATAISLYFVGGYQTAADTSATEPEVLFLGGGIDFGFWFGQSSYDSLLGVEFSTNFGFVLGDTEAAGFYKTALGLNMELFTIDSETLPLRMVIHGGSEIIGHDDVWWDSGSRINVEAGARLIFGFEEIPSMLAYSIGTPIAWIDDEDLGAPDRLEHHARLRILILDDEDGAYSFLFHGVMGKTTLFNSRVEQTDYRLMVSLGLGF